MLFEHGFRLEDSNDIAQLLDGLFGCVFQFECQYSEGQFLRVRHLQRLVQFPLDDSKLSPQQEDLEILSTIGVVTQQDNFDQSRKELGEDEPAHRSPK